MNLVTLIGLALVALGVAFFWAAPYVQQLGLKMMGQPRNAIARWSRDVAASTTSRRTIRMTGVLCIIVGGALMSWQRVVRAPKCSTGCVLVPQRLQTAFFDLELGREVVHPVLAW
jgi:hypothetical protein